MRSPTHRSRPSRSPYRTPGRWALHAEATGFNQLTHDAEPGTTIAVVGENGAGKTTLLRALSASPHARTPNSGSATRMSLASRRTSAGAPGSLRTGPSSRTKHRDYCTITQRPAAWSSCVEYSKAATAPYPCRRSRQPASGAY